MFVASNLNIWRRPMKYSISFTDFRIDSWPDDTLLQLHYLVLSLGHLSGAEETMAMDAIRLTLRTGKSISRKINYSINKFPIARL